MHKNISEKEASTSQSSARVVDENKEGPEARGGQDREIEKKNFSVICYLMFDDLPWISVAESTKEQGQQKVD